jgi:hypothetical protein
MNDHVRLSCEKTLPHEIQQSKASSSPEKHDANLDPVVAEKESNEFSGIHLKCNDSVCTTVYSPLSEIHYASFPYCKLSTTRKSETQTPQSFKGKKTREPRKSPKRAKCSLTSEKAKKSILL